ncbi:hypothetical protein Plhal304r1_c011g0041751 [Plasmopara halstedii]
MTCFHIVINIVTAPIVMHTMKCSMECAHNTINAQIIVSQLAACEADDVVIGCLEKALQIKETYSLIDVGCPLLQVVFTLSTTTSDNTKKRWISVAISILQKNFSQPIKHEFLFGATLTILSRNKETVEVTNGHYTKLTKLILGFLNNSIQHVRSCTLLQTECAGAIQVLKQLLEAFVSLPDTLVSSCLGVLGKLISVFVLSPSTTAHDHLQVIYETIASFASRDYLGRLVNRLGKCIRDEEGLEGAPMIDMVDEFEALAALLYFNLVDKRIYGNHPLVTYLAALVENYNTYTQVLGDHAQFFLELGCLGTKLLSKDRRKEVINDALCQFAENAHWHSMRWIVALADKPLSGATLIVEYVLLRIVSGYTILKAALLAEHLDALSYLLRWNSFRELVLASSHVFELQSVLWQLVHVNDAWSDVTYDGYDVAVSLLNTFSSLLSFQPSIIFSGQNEKFEIELLVRFCLKSLDEILSDSLLDVIQITSIENVYLSTSIILQHCIQRGAEHARCIVHHRVTRHAFQDCERPGCERWCLVVLKTVIESHNLICAKKLLHLSLKQANIMMSLAEILTNTDVLSQTFFLDCLALVDDSTKWQSDCVILFNMLHQHTSNLVSGHASILNSRQVNYHISSAIALLSFKYVQLCLKTLRNELESCVQAITQSVLSFNHLFMLTPAFTTKEYSTIVSIHLKIVYLAALSTTGKDRDISIDSTDTLGLVLGPMCISNEALAVYFDLAVITYLFSSVQAATWLFIEAMAPVLSRIIERLASGSIRSKCLERSLLSYFTSLRAVLGTKWESREVNQVLRLLRICLFDRWSLNHLLKAVLSLPKGLCCLFDLARVAPNHDANVIYFLSQHLRAFRCETQRIGELELSTLLSIKVEKTSGSEVLRRALKTLKHVARQENYASLCSELGTISIMYDVICVPSQNQDATILALEICCCLARFGHDVTHESFTIALQRLLVRIEISDTNIRSHMAFLILEIQCQTQVVPILSQSSGKTAMYTKELYIASQKLVSPTRKPGPQNCDLLKTENKSSALRQYLDRGKVRQQIISNCQSLIQSSDQMEKNTLPDCLSTFGKSGVKTLEYVPLCKAIKQLSFILDDFNMVINCDYVSALVPALSTILTLHKVTNATMCTIMQILDKIAFAKPSILLLNNQLDIPALFSSCSLHHRSSLLFAVNLCRFCNSIGAELKTLTENKFKLSLVGLISLLLELLQHWRSNFEIVDQCIEQCERFTVIKFIVCIVVFRCN